MSNDVAGHDGLAELGARTLDVVLDAIDAGDTTAARQAAKRMYSEFSSMHDLYCEWVTGLASYIARTAGDDAAGEAIEETVRHYNDKLTQFYEGKSDRQRIEMLAAGIRGHLQEVEVAEYDNYYEIVATNCGSGGRMIAAGAYEGEGGFHLVSGPSAMTFGRDELPIYCSHCHFQNQITPKGLDAPIFETIPSSNLGVEPCRLRVHKTDDRATPGSDSQ